MMTILDRVPFPTSLRLAHISMFLLIGSIIVIIALHALAPRYERVAEERLYVADFSRPLTGWHVRVNEGHVNVAKGILSLSNPAAGETAFASRLLPTPDRFQHVAVAAEVRVTGIVDGDAVVHGARIYLASRDETGRFLWHLPHDAGVFYGTQDWQPVLTFLPVATNATALKLGVGLSGAQGLMEVRNLSVTQAREYEAFRFASLILLTIMGAALLWTGVLMLQALPNWRTRLSFILLGTAILLGTMAPESLKRQVHDIFSVKVMTSLTASPSPPPPPSGTLASGKSPYIFLDKLGHLGLFFLLGALARFVRPHDSLISQSLSILLFAAATEVLQLYASNRQASLTDFAIDGIGVLLGVFLIQSILFYRQK